MPRVFVIVLSATTALGATAVPTAVAAPTRGTAPGICSQAYLPLPDPACQPGAINPDVTQETIGSTICVAGWTRTVRPPVAYTNALKARQIAEYGYSDTNPANYEEDHLIPLELGGAPRDPRNLWPEPRYDAGGGTAADKDEVENALRKKVCAGLTPLAAARTIMAVDWRRGRSAAASRRGPAAPR
ncbi:hypothetical protein [Actinoallomurus soli]|uniref:hypothetical protein n=1 Tax=Actinoallomurus soli TaxID=2952535 RepID=UPI00209221B2|nr:hypothetical protein [Actinoallomurus soli]MCO5967013.1 hypothetical protein [Actinoallomurus soli]